MTISPENEIPDGEILYRFCKPEALPIGQSEIPTSIFNDKKLSCDWKRYREDPKSSFHISEGKSIVISITVTDEIRNPRNPKRAGEVVHDWKQKIYHDPISVADDSKHGANTAHSLIEGKKKIAVQEALVHNSVIIDL